VEGWPRSEDKRRRLVTLAGLALGSIALWQTTWGSLLLYPFTILATWFHEIGHGLGAAAAGGRFERLVLFPDGSGLAVSLMPAEAPALALAAAGPLGPPVAGALLIAASRSRRATRLALAALAAALLLSTAIWVRSLVGWIVLPLLALALVAVILRGSSRVQEFVAQFLGVQAAVSTYHQTWYLFSTGGTVGGVRQPSDTAAIADYLLLPYWFWAAAITAAIAALLFGSLRFALGR
jgi:hypothetical protein